MTITLTEKQLREAVIEYMGNTDGERALKFANMVFNELFAHTSMPIGDLTLKIIRKYYVGFDDEMDADSLIKITQLITKLNRRP